VRLGATAVVRLKSTFRHGVVFLLLLAFYDLLGIDWESLIIQHVGDAMP
jgi:hypothetical protein